MEEESMATTWFCLVAVMLAIYVLQDGFDLGAGAIQMLVAHTPEERRQAIAGIGPLWDGNDVWLLAAGGTLYFAFPALYASGFYLPLMIVLWLLILPRHIRGIPQPHPERGVDSAAGFCALHFQLVAVRIFWRGARQRRSRRACGCLRLGEQTGILD
jgi:hypothetical protein